MRHIPKAIYQTIEELDRRIALREAEAALLIDGSKKQSVLIEIAQLRTHVDAKRWIASPGLRPDA